MFTTCIYTYVQVTFVEISVLHHSPNRQLDRQTASEMATRKNRASKSFIREICALIWFLDRYSMFKVSIASYDQVS